MNVVRGSNYPIIATQMQFSLLFSVWNELYFIEYNATAICNLFVIYWNEWAYTISLTYIQLQIKLQQNNNNQFSLPRKFSKNSLFEFAEVAAPLSKQCFLKAYFKIETCFALGFLLRWHQSQGDSHNHIEGKPHIDAKAYLLETYVFAFVFVNASMSCGSGY